MTQMPIKQSDRAKAIMYFVLAMGYGVAFGMLWTRVVRDRISTWPEFATFALFFLGLFLPALSLLSASLRYHGKVTGEDLNRSAADEYVKLWRGEQPLGKSLSFCFISTFLLIATTERLGYVTSHPSPVRSVILFSVGFVLILGLHLVATRGTWRSARQYAGAKTWALLAQGAVIASYVAMLFLLAWMVWHGYSH